MCFKYLSFTESVSSLNACVSAIRFVRHIPHGTPLSLLLLPQILSSYLIGSPDSGQSCDWLNNFSDASLGQPSAKDQCFILILFVFIQFMPD